MVLIAAGTSFTGAVPSALAQGTKAVDDTHHKDFRVKIQRITHDVFDVVEPTSSTAYMTVGTTATSTGATTDLGPTATAIRAERVTLLATVDPALAGVHYVWTIGGSRIRDYEHNFTDASLHKEYRFETINTTTDTNGNGIHDALEQAQVSFFFTQPTTPGNEATVSVTAYDAANLAKGTASVNFTVNKLTDENRDIYCKDGDEDRSPGFNALITHDAWHVDNERATTAPSPFPGEDFLLFHAKAIVCYSKWRTTFNMGAIPAATDSGMATQFGAAGLNRPSYLTVAGGTTTWGPGNYVKLADFPNMAELGTAVRAPWHNNGHGDIGNSGSAYSDMLSTRRAPKTKDDTFWRWHTVVDGPRHDRFPLTDPANPTTVIAMRQKQASSSIRLASLSLASLRGAIGSDEFNVGTVADVLSDRANVVAVSPVSSSQDAKKVTSILVAFDEKVSIGNAFNKVGVTPDKLTVNGSPAKAVKDVGIKSRFMVYEFTGFNAPDGDTVQVKLAGTSGYNSASHTFIYSPSN
jgi:hypothetical protein